MSAALTERPAPAERPVRGRMPPGERLRALVSPPRLTGLDAARGLAVLGMLGAHVGSPPALAWNQPSSYLSLVQGNSSILFALLAGISIALMTGRERGPQPHELPRMRAAMVGRGAAIFGIGLALELLGVGIAVILTFYGVVYLAMIPVLRLRPLALLAIAVPLALLGPVLVEVLRILTLGGTGSGADMMVNGLYQATTWVPLMLAGIAIGRFPLSRVTVAAALVGIGGALAVGGLVLSLSLGSLFSAIVPGYDDEIGASSWSSEPSGDYSSGSGDEGSWEDDEEDWGEDEEDLYEGMVPADEVDIDGMWCLPPGPGDPSVFCEPREDGGSDDATTDDDITTDDGTKKGEDWDGVSSSWEDYPGEIADSQPVPVLLSSFVSTSPHSGASLETITSGGFATFIVGLLLLIARLSRWVLLPVAALGSMPLTAYTLHALIITAVAGFGGWIASNGAWAVIGAGMILACLAWAAFLGRGPLERFAAWSARRAADAMAPRTPEIADAPQDTSGAAAPRSGEG